MVSFYFILLGIYLYYSKSKYFPNFLFKTSFTGSDWIGLLLIFMGTAWYVQLQGWAGGLLLALAASSLAMVLIQLFAVLGKKYFYGFIAVVHSLLLIELISYAS